MHGIVTEMFKLPAAVRRMTVMHAELVTVCATSCADDDGVRVRQRTHLSSCDEHSGDNICSVCIRRCTRTAAGQCGTDEIFVVIQFNQRIDTRFQRRRDSRSIDFNTGHYTFATAFNPAQSENVMVKG
jgi:hypothetical protein